MEIISNMKTFEIADFILQDRRRICEPLVKFQNNVHGNPSDYIVEACFAIGETLSNAGLEQEK